jgi:hypothetical protein
MKKLQILFLAVMLPLMFWGNSDAMMNGGMMQNSGNFGMMSGMAGAPVIGDDGTAYFVVGNPTAKPGKTPTSNSFESTLIAINPSGETVSLVFNGLLSKPIINGSSLVATASLPNMGNYQMMGNGGTNAANTAVCPLHCYTAVDCIFNTFCGFAGWKLCLSPNNCKWQVLCSDHRFW